MRIALWVEERGGRPAVNLVMEVLLGELARRGHRVRVEVPELLPVRVGAELDTDLVLLKTTTSMALSAATAAEATGVRVLNPAAASVRVADKAAALALLAAAGVPVPTTFLLPRQEGTPAVAPATLPSGTAWVTKPVNGIHGRGVRFHATLADAVLPVADETGTTAPPGSGRLLQQRIGDEGPDVKVYAVRDALFAGRKPFSATSFASDDIEPVDLTPAERDAVVRAGTATGLTIYGVDLRRDPAGSRVIDVNPFPGFRGFAAAVPALLAEVERDAG